MKNEYPHVEVTCRLGAVSAGVGARALLSCVTIRRNVVAETLTRVAPELAPGFKDVRYARLDENAISGDFGDMPVHDQREIPSTMG